MQLDALPGRDAQGSVRVFAAEIVQVQVLRGGQATAGDPDAHHELVLLLQALLLTAGRGVSIVLLVCAVEFEQLVVLFCEMRARAVRSSRFSGAAHILFQEHGAASAAVAADRAEECFANIDVGGFAYWKNVESFIRDVPHRAAQLSFSSTTEDTRRPFGGSALS